MRIVTTPLAAPVRWPATRPACHPRELRDAFLRAPGNEAAFAALDGDGTLVVTTGQQPGLFTGPLYTIHKALSAAALAHVLERRWNTRVVPVFWLAGDDHDFAEANHASWLAQDGSLTTVTLRERSRDAPLQPMYRELLGPEIQAATERLEGDLPPSEFRETTIDWIRRHFRPDNTVAGAYGAALAELLAPFGILCLDSTHPAIKRVAAPHLLRALDSAAELEEALDQRTVELAREGTDPGVAAADGATLVMVEGKLGRDRLVRAGNGFVTRRGHESFDRAALERIATEDPQRLSPNVLLRPVVESALLPTVAYVAGPGELRYLDLTGPIYSHLGVTPQLPVPRWSGILVEQRVDRVLEKFGATLEELLRTGSALESRVVRAQLPEEASQALERLRSEVGRGYETLAQAAKAIDPTIEKSIQNIGHQAQGGVQDAEKRLVQHLRKRSETEFGQIGRSRSAVLPGGKPQERVLTVAPFLARYGPGLLEELRQVIAAWYGSGLEAPSSSP
jgi:bacillithiol biosynthesis cysteine-adding enzyme BshC